jgi:hypothetical protein
VNAGLAVAWRLGEVHTAGNDIDLRDDAEAGRPQSSSRNLAVVHRAR